jgi:hypothetical protein
MKNLKADFNDSLRPEYRRSDFGEMIRGKYATTQVEFGELTHLLMACIGEDEGFTFTRNPIDNYLANHERGDWTYEIDNANQLTLRYWVSKSASIDEAVTNPRCISTNQDISDFKNLIQERVRVLKTRAQAS